MEGRLPYYGTLEPEEVDERRARPSPLTGVRVFVLAGALVATLCMVAIAFTPMGSHVMKSTFNLMMAQEDIICQCEHGTPKTWASGQCKRMMDKRCAACNEGYSRNEQETACIADNFCYCENGIEQTGAECTAEAAQTWIDSMNQMEDAKTIMKDAHAASLAAATQEEVDAAAAQFEAAHLKRLESRETLDAANSCAQCFQGFRRDEASGACLENVCTCEGGQAASGIFCIQDGAEICQFFDSEADTTQAYTVLDDGTEAIAVGIDEQPTGALDESPRQR